MLGPGGGRRNFAGGRAVPGDRQRLDTSLAAFDPLHEEIQVKFDISCKKASGLGEMHPKS